MRVGRRIPLDSGQKDGGVIIWLYQYASDGIVYRPPIKEECLPGIGDDIRVDTLLSDSIAIFTRGGGVR